MEATNQRTMPPVVLVPGEDGQAATNSSSSNINKRHQLLPFDLMKTFTSTASAHNQRSQSTTRPVSAAPSFSPNEPTERPSLILNNKQTQQSQVQLAKITKWLCAIIFVLVLIVLALIIFNGPQTRMSRVNKFLDRISQTTSATTTSHEAGKLQADGSDDHFTMTSLAPGSDMLDHDHDDDHQASSQDQDGHDTSTQDDHANQLVRGGNFHNSLTSRNRFMDGANDIGPRRPGEKPRGNPEAICMTPGCVRAAAQILNNMDNNTRPCDDFYQFACGRWIQTQVIPDEKTSLSVFSQNTADLNLKLRALIERPARLDEDPPIVGQMRNMYASCMNTSDIETRGDEPLLDVLRDLGGWPVLTVKTTPIGRVEVSTTSKVDDPASLASSMGAMLAALRSASSGQQPGGGGGNHERRRRNGRAGERSSRARRQLEDQLNSTSTNNGYSWLDTLIKFRQRGFSHDMIIDLSVVPDVRNSRRYIIELDQSSLGMPDRSYYFRGSEDTTVRAYLVQMVQSAIALGAPRQEAQRQMLEVFQFETALANISWPREQRRNISRLYNKMLGRDLYKLAPDIDWTRYLRSLLKDDQVDLDQDEVIVKVPSFLRQLNTLLITTDQRVIANYMIWRIVRASMSGLGRKWREIAHTYASVTTGRQVEEPRWEQCLGSIDNTLGMALSAFYVKNHFNERSKVAALEMVEYIREEFLRILDEIDWMDEETREEAKKKARGIASYIGYPNELLQDALIEELYANVRMERTNFYQNVRNLRIWSTDYAFSHLRKPNKRGDWKKHSRAAVVNAYYNPLENSIEFPAGILQGAFFDAERPNYMNFGAIGYVIGHEITHGFDDRGRQFDRDGNERNWWKPKTDSRFKERAQCIIEQYGNYTLTQDQSLRVNGLNTQGENIADNGGIKESFRAYRRWTKDHGREPRLPGLNYSPDQLFWISAANIWCGKFRPEVLKLRINSGVHSPAQFRVVGPLSNSVEFAQSFKCPLGSPMNPSKKCSVWSVVVVLVAMLSVNYLPDSMFHDFQLDPRSVVPNDYDSVIPQNWNTKLSDGQPEFIQLNNILGPESIAIAKSGLIYTGLADGRLVELDPRNKYSVRTVARVNQHLKGKCPDNVAIKQECGRFLQVRFNNDTLYALEASAGLYKVDTKTGSKALLGPKAFNKVNLFNSFAFDPVESDLVYLTISSTRWNLLNIVWSFFEQDATGQLLVLDTKTGKRAIIFDGMRLANGLDVYSKRDQLLVTETTGSSISSVSLKDIKTAFKLAKDGDKLKGLQRRPLIPLVPGMPDNIIVEGDLAYIALPFVKLNGKELFDHLGTMPNVRKALGRFIYGAGKLLEYVSINFYQHPLLEVAYRELKCGHLIYRIIQNDKSAVLEYNLATGATKLYGSNTFGFISEALPDGKGNLFLGSFRSPFLVKQKV